MSTALAPINMTPIPVTATPIDASILEKVVARGDLSELTPSQKVAWYRARCEAAGLDPRTQPFEYVALKGGKLKLYATKTATDQLIAIHRLNVKIVDRKYDEHTGIYEVHCSVAFPDGRCSEDIGAVYIGQMTGEDLANGVMKCYHPDTEILTSAGWRAVATVTTDDLVAEFNPKTREIGFARPIRTVESQTDSWIRIEDNISCQVVTPNHDVIVGGEKIEAGELMACEATIGRWKGKDQLPPIPVCGVTKGIGLDEPEAFVRLLAAFLSDGAYTPSESCVQFGFHKVRKVDRLRKILADCDLPFSENVYDVQHNTKLTSDYETRTVFYVKSPAPWRLGHYLMGSKALTWKTVLAMNGNQARLLIEEMQFWDGCMDDKGGIIFQQTDQEIVDSLQTLCVLNGIELSARRKEVSGPLENAKPMTRMRMSTATERSLRRSRRSYQLIPNESGLDAYCLEMPAGTLITRFEGRVAISGNCVTKAKRRTVLSACGLGMLDESEIDSIPGAVRQPARDFPPPDHHAKDHPNDTGHGSGAYADPKSVAAYKGWLREFIEDVNQKWLDAHTSHDGVPADGLKGELLRSFGVSGHLVKAGREHGLINAPETPRAGQYDKFAAILWERDREATLAEARAYAKREWRAEAAKMAAVSEPEDESQETPGNDGPDPDGDYPAEREPGQDDGE